MTPIIITSIIFIAGFVVIWLFMNEDTSVAVLSSFVWLLGGGSICALLFCVISSFTSGTYRGYSTGEREGYLTKVSEKGIIWKTYECQMQVGTGQMAALQEPFDFSIPRWNDKLYKRAQNNIGGKIRLQYVQWFVMPFRIGSTDYETTKIVFYDEGKQIEAFFNGRTP